ncbi:MAG: long-chain fatty acid--CoA ligase [Desulfobacterales bacterium]|nr:long-chain fatty acid--CoA ligase [Desulfobacterales bacterium]
MKPEATTLQISKTPNYAILIHERVNKYGDKVALRAKKNDQWEAITWRELGDKVNCAAKALLEMGLEETQMISVFSQNKPECTISDIAALSIRCVPVFIYPTNTASQAEYIVNDCEAQIIFVGDQEQYDKAISIFKSAPSLKKIIAFNPGIKMQGNDFEMYFEEFLGIGKKSDKDAQIKDRLSRASQEDLLTLIYTSGTTGTPKGVILTHANIFFQAAAHDARLLNPNENDVSLCFLPLSHIFERTWTYYALYKGMEIYYLDDPKKIIDVIKEVRPTIMCAVPRIYEKIYAAVFNALDSAPPLKKKLFKWAVKTGAAANNLKKDELPVPLGLKIKHRIADKLVLSKIRDLVGGRIRFMPCAGAPLSQEIEEFFYAVGIFVWYGYGLSETTATSTCHPPYHFKFGLVGTPLPGVQVKIAPNGEILVKGGNVMKGYYKKPKETAEVFEDGWFKTGDIGEFDANGELRITDRIKDLMKTSGGKYIAPQLIESLIGADHFVEQVVVIGDNKKFVAALIVPSFEALEEYARNQNIPFKSRFELVKHPDIVEFYRKRIDERSRNLAGFEKIKEFTLLPEELTVDRNEITPTMKIKRKVVAEKFNDVIDGMYGGGMPKRQN